MMDTLIDRRLDVEIFKTQVEPRVLLQSFEHFDVISTVDKSTDHGKLL